MRTLDLQGHRGARGLLPENTLPAFARALAIGVTTLELDCAITRDGVIVVSHDATLNPDITRDERGRWITRDDLAIAQFTFAALQRFDVGRINPACDYAQRFPRQQPIDGTRMPRLEAVLELAQRGCGTGVRLNIETKISPLFPLRTLAPDAFATTLIKMIKNNNLQNSVTVQSFDWRTLATVQREAPLLKTAYLSAQQPFFDNILAQAKSSPWNAGLHVSQFDYSVPRMIVAAGGAIWSPCSEDVDAANLSEAHALGLSVVVWTVNDEAQIQRMIELGVDGIISDYPDVLRRVAGAAGCVLPAPASGGLA